MKLKSLFLMTLCTTVPLLASEHVHDTYAFKDRTKQREELIAPLKACYPSLWNRIKVGLRAFQNFNPQISSTKDTISTIIDIFGLLFRSGLAINNFRNAHTTLARESMAIHKRIKRPLARIEKDLGLPSQYERNRLYKRMYALSEIPVLEKEISETNDEMIKDSLTKKIALIKAKYNKRSNKHLRILGIHDSFSDEDITDMDRIIKESQNFLREKLYIETKLQVMDDSLAEYNVLNNRLRQMNKAQRVLGISAPL